MSKTKERTHTEAISAAFRERAGLKAGASPDPSLGLSTAKGKSGGKPVDTGQEPVHPTEPDRTKVETATGDRVAAKKAEHAETRKASTPSARTAKKTAKK